MKHLFEKYEELAKQGRKIQQNKKDLINDMVAKLQEETDNGYIEFTDETSYPNFFDDTIGEYDSVIKARVKEGTLELITANDIDIWFEHEAYGELDLDDFVGILCHYFI